MKECPEGKVWNPKTNRCITIGLAAHKQMLKEMENKLPELIKQQMNAMKTRNIPLLRELAIKIEEEKLKIKKQENLDMPDYLKQCINPITKNLEKLHTIEGEQDIKEIIKNKKQLIIIDGLCYDIKTLYELIQADIPNGNVWGTVPYVKAEGLTIPFSKDVKDTIITEGIKRKLLSKNAKWIDHTPLTADDKEMRGFYELKIKQTPTEWLKKGWGMNGSAFPTNKYYAITFEFPNKTIKQNPGKTVIFPYEKKYKNFIDKKLISVYESGALWSKKMSITDRKEVINPNIHMIFEDNQPNRWYDNKLINLEEEILKYSPAFI